MAKSPAAHSTELHKQAFELYYDLRNANAVAREMKLDQHTVRRWRHGDMNCSCGWHNWDMLVQEREAALAKRIELLEQGVVDPIAHEQALLDLEPSKVEISPERLQQLRPAAQAMDRSDLERLSHLEFIYAKLFYHITGCVIDYGTLVDLAGKQFSLEECERYFKNKGLEPRNLEQCINTLLKITDEIKSLREDLGLRKRVPRTAPSATPAQPPVKGGGDTVITSKPANVLADLRRLKGQLEAMSPEEVRAVTERFNESEDTNVVTLASSG